MEESVQSMHAVRLDLLSQVLGAKKKVLSGFSTATLQPHQGFIYGCAVLQQTPQAHRAKAARLVAAKCTLMARVDAYGQDPSV
ncbi:U4 U6 small nuclear ribonucleo Prp31-like, partial [Haematococcus lacustris]